MKLNKILKKMDPEKKEILAMNVNEKMSHQEKMRYVKKVAKLEKVDMNTAWAICTGQTDPVEYEYTLGFKMADTAMSVALFGTKDKQGRRNAADVLMMSLCEEEKEIFLNDVFDYEKGEKRDKKQSFAEKRLQNWVQKSEKGKYRI